MNLTKSLIVVGLAIVSVAAYAARPMSIEFDTRVRTIDGREYMLYTLTCTNGKQAALSAWDNPVRWCPGDGGDYYCEKRQIKIANEVCLEL